MADVDPWSRPSVAETHVSTLFFLGDRVYKVKKPVALDFVDFSTEAARERACRREVELNRRLAPDVYLGVAEMRGIDGQAREPMVVMRRMPDDRRLATIVRRGEFVDDCVQAAARQIAVFHARADTSPAIAAAGSIEAVRANWESNFATLAPFVGDIVDAPTAATIETLASRYLDGREPLFAARVAQGKIRDGHGDLLTEDIFCLDDGPRILDCIEFDDRLRWGDVVSDVAFLAMDLERVGAPDLAARFLSWYRELSGEAYPETLAQHYIAYRAHIRAKVACLRAAQGDADAGAQARLLLRMTHEHLSRGSVVLTLVGGLPGTGKSMLAAGLSARTGAVLLRSDEIRKDLAGIPHETDAGDEYRAGLYDDRSTEATYDELLGRAQRLLGLGESVVLDASWSNGPRRDEAAAIARDTSSGLVEFRCEVSTDIARRRIAARARIALDASDATDETARRMAADFDPWPSASTIDTSSPPERCVTFALDAFTA